METKTFLFQYRFDCIWYGFDVDLPSWAAAEALANQSPRIILDGELQNIIPKELGRIATAYVKLSDMLWHRER
jgi:hypothetical protein